MADVLIFDDDPTLRNIMRDLISDMGWEVKCFPDGRDALLHIRTEKPRLVLTDMMMPGLDGNAISLMVKNDPQVAQTKVVVVSGKVYQQDKDKALKQASADLYIEKPFDLQEFSRVVSGLLQGQPPAPHTQAASAWRVRVWGGSPLGCLSLERGDDLFVLDAGQGLARLVADPGAWTKARGVWLLLTHFHDDHVAGLPAAAAWVKAGRGVRVLAPRDPEKPLSERLLEAWSGVSPQELRSQVQATELSEGGRVAAGPLAVEVMLTMHPGTCLAYKLEAGGRKLVFASDNELKEGRDELMTGAGDKLAAFSKLADLLVHDARYSDEDYPSFSRQGHSCPSAAVKLASRAGARRLMLYHADPRYDEAARRRALAAASAAAAREKGGPECLLPLDGSEVSL